MLEQPLYYAAKWGGYYKDNPDYSFPANDLSWDADGDGRNNFYEYNYTPASLHNVDVIVQHHAQPQLVDSTSAVKFVNITGLP